MFWDNDIPIFEAGDFEVVEPDVEEDIPIYVCEEFPAVEVSGSIDAHRRPTRELPIITMEQLAAGCELLAEIRGEK